MSQIKLTFSGVVGEILLETSHEKFSEEFADVVTTGLQKSFDSRKKGRRGAVFLPGGKGTPMLLVGVTLDLSGPLGLIQGSYVEKLTAALPKEGPTEGDLRESLIFIVEYLATSPHATAELFEKLLYEYSPW